MKQIEKVNVPNKGRHYVLPSKKLVPSVTNVLGIIAKPALIHWAANEERAYCVETFKEMGGIQDASRFPLDIQVEEFNKRLGPKKAHQMKLAKAGDIGSYVHELIQHELRGRLGKFEPEPHPHKLSKEDIEAADVAFMAWEDWAKEVEVVPKQIEQTVYSETIGSAGTVDLFGELTLSEKVLGNTPVDVLSSLSLEFGDRYECCFDWKSSKRSKSQPNGIYPEALTQVCTYAQMLVDAGDATDACCGMIVRLPKSLDDDMFETGDIDTQLVLPVERAKRAKGFEAHVALWQFIKNGEVK